MPCKCTCATFVTQFWKLSPDLKSAGPSCTLYQIWSQSDQLNFWPFVQVGPDILSHFTALVPLFWHGWSYEIWNQQVQNVLCAKYGPNWMITTCCYLGEYFVPCKCTCATFVTKFWKTVSRFEISRSKLCFVPNLKPIWGPLFFGRFFVWGPDGDAKSERVKEKLICTEI